MTYCGYVGILMVVMYITSIFLFMVLMMMLLMVFVNKEVLLISMKLFNVGIFGDFELLFSIWGLMFLMMVVIISFSVMVFSFAYMNGLAVKNFIFLYLSFVFSMMWLVLNNNFYWMMLGWDGLGVVSFLLIVFYMNYESINNGLFTMFQNRIGDLFFVLFILGMIDLGMSLNLVLKWGLLMLVIGSCVKSAQFPFNAWLLSAMSAPTPISSLVHSSTLVVAGVYIILQYSYCLVDVLVVLKIISLMSLVLSTFGLLNESDMKKLIAYSTMNHVSLMMYLLSFKLFKVAYFHLNVHAMFKSMMFMCFGFVMLSSYHAQDKRLISLVMVNPLIKVLYYFSCLCLMGLPFLSGFFSKDFIIEKMMENSVEVSFVIFLLLFLSISIYYSMKLLSLTFYYFSYQLVDKNYIGMFSLFFMLLVMIVFINIFISLVFSVSLEMLSFKMMIYLFMIMFFFLSVFTNLNFKTFLFDIKKSFKEVWTLDYLSLDKFVYFNMSLFLEYITVMTSVKLFMLMNWWIVILVVVLF